MSDEKTDSQSGEQDTRQSAEPDSGSADKPAQSRDDLSASKTQPMPSQPRSFVAPDKASEAAPPEKTAPGAARSAFPPAAAAKSAGTDTVIHKKRAVAENASDSADPVTLAPKRLASGTSPVSIPKNKDGSVSALRRPQGAAAATGPNDTVRLRVQPAPQATAAAAFPSSQQRGRQRLPDIRKRPTEKSAGTHYGPFSLIFGFVWLAFKMIFFGALLMGVGAAVGFFAITWYIKTPEETVPSVRGMRTDEAVTVLGDKGLSLLKIATEPSGLVAPGEIIEQYPPAGSRIKKGRSVSVKVSSGRSRFTVPGVVNETLDNARNKIRGAGLEVGNETRIEDQNVPKEVVISQQPAAGTGLEELQKIDLLVSAGPPGKSLAMPDLVNTSLAEAKAALKRLGLTDFKVSPEGSTEHARVVEQEPLVGKIIFQSDSVTLKVKE